MIEVDDIAIAFKLRTRRVAGTQDWLAKIGRNHREQFWALDGVSFSVEKGETIGIIGANGSGKSTLLRVMAGIFRPHRGTVSIRGRVATLLTTTAGFQPESTGRENIYMNGVLVGLRKEQIDGLLGDIIEFSGLGQFIDQPVRTYSSGMYARLGFSVAVHANGDVLLIDEVLGAGDAAFAERARGTMEKLLSQGKTVVLVSHSTEAVRRFSSRVLWLDSGKVRMIGDPSTVVQAYLEGDK